MTRRHIAALALCLTTLSLRVSAAPVPDLVGVRPVGLGDAYTALADQAEGAIHNPASLGVREGVWLFGQTNLNRRDRIRLDPKGIAYGWRGVGLAWTNRIAIAPDGIDDYNTVSAGARLSSRFTLGASAKLWRMHPSRRFQALGSSATYDIGILAAPVAAWRVGARAGSLERGAGVQDFELGIAHVAGRLALAGDLGWRDVDGFRRSIGAEARLTRRLLVRAGLRDGDPSVGAGVALGAFRLDAAWTRADEGGIVFVGGELDVAVSRDTAPTTR